MATRGLQGCEWAIRLEVTTSTVEGCVPRVEIAHCLARARLGASSRSRSGPVGGLRTKLEVLSLSQFESLLDNGQLKSIEMVEGPNVLRPTRLDDTSSKRATWDATATPSPTGFSMSIPTSS